MVKNLKRIRRNFQYKNCSLASLVLIWKISEFLAKYKIDIIREDFSLSSLHLVRIIAHAMHTLHKYLEEGNHENSTPYEFW